VSDTSAAERLERLARDGFGESEPDLSQNTNNWWRAAEAWAVLDKRRAAQAARELAAAADRWADQLDAEAERLEKTEG
jgi:hypothetical protein